MSGPQRRWKAGGFCLCLLACLLLALLPLPWEVWGMPLAGRLLQGAASRLCGVAALLLLLSHAGWTRPWLSPACPRPPRPLRLAVCGMATLVCCNNLPLSAILHGRLALTASGGEIFCFALLCLSVGLLEELLFRAYLLGRVFRPFQNTRGRCVAALLLTSLLFGLSHLANLAEGAGLAPTLLQVGYSCLTGCLFGTVFLVCRQPYTAALLHALYNFCGLLYVQCGTGDASMDRATVYGTVALSLATAAVCLAALLRPGRSTSA